MPRILALVAFAIFTAIAHADRSKDNPTPAVPGFDRFHAADPKLPEAGFLLLGELNCVSCHAAGKGQAEVIQNKTAPILDHVGTRIRRSFLEKFLADPIATKPGTTMPHLLADDPQKEHKVQALVHFLSSTGNIKHEAPDKKFIASGNDLYHKIGCVACHGTRDAKGKQDKLFDTSVPLWGLKSKYTIHSLRVFLENPHAVRPAGRMPGLLNAKEAQEVAHYLLSETKIGFIQGGKVDYQVYKGQWKNIPDFSKMKPSTSGKAHGLDLGVAKQNQNYGVRFQGFLKIDADGNYNFHTMSDDGSKLYVDGKLVVNNDGIRPPTSKSGSVKLAKGVRKVTIDFMQGGGGAELLAEFDGPGTGRVNLSHALTDTEEPKPATPDAKDEDYFALDPKLVEEGRGLFAALGCANCHQMKQDKALAKRPAPSLEQIAAGGCLAEKPKPGLPQYPLSSSQRQALNLALKSWKNAVAPVGEALVHRSLVQFNCYACHDRNKIGGVEEVANPSFKTVQPEMGDEGRIPPSLTGVGAKLTPTYLKKIFEQGAHDRPYMHTRMPKFGNGNIGHLTPLFAQLDPELAAPKVDFEDLVPKARAEARNMISGNMLGCVKCHTFAGVKAEGVQGIDMAIFTERLKSTWFHNYLLDPNKFRPGTRMPTAWPKGETLLTNILGGKSDHQIAAIWMYLLDGKSARLPIGMGSKKSIPLQPFDDAILYRNFIAKMPRAIGVGYPEKAHLVFDATDLRLAMIWQGGFMDAAKHWTDRGQGFEEPLGDHVQTLGVGPDFAILKDADQPWPTKADRDQGAQFKGYSLSKDQRPTFLYTIAGLSVEDFPTAVSVKNQAGMKRTITATSAKPAEGLYFRVGAANKITNLKDGWFKVGAELKVRVEAPAMPIIRSQGKKDELLIPMRGNEPKTVIIAEYSW